MKITASLFCVLALVVLGVGDLHASKTYQRTAINTGTPSSLDGIDGDDLSDGDWAFVADASSFYVYTLNATSGATAAGHLIVKPVLNAGLKRWILKTESGLLDGARPEWFGAVGDGSTNDTVAIQAAITASCSSGKCVPVQLAAKDYRINSTLNLAKKPGVILRGTPGIYGTGTRLLGYCGDSSPTIDITGSIGAVIEDIAIKNYTSTIGILMGYDTAGPNYQFFSRLKNVAVTYAAYNLASASANHNLGTVGIANIGGESSSYENIFIQAMLPMIFSEDNTTSYVLGDVSSTHTFASAYSTLPTTAWTMGDSTFSGYINLQAYGEYRPALVLNNANNTKIPGLYTASVSAGLGWTTKIGVQQHNGYHNHLHWLAEGQDIGLALRSDQKSTFDVEVKSTVSTAHPAVALYGGAGAVYGTTFGIMLDASPNRYAVGKYSVNNFTGALAGGDITTSQQVAGKIIDPSAMSVISKTRYKSAAENEYTGEKWNVASWDPGVVANDASATTTITVTNASPGDMVIAGHAALTSTGDVLTATVSALNTVRVLYFNRTGASRSPGAAYLTVRVFKLFQ